MSNSITWVGNATVPGRHAGGGVLARVLPPVMGSMLELGDASGEVSARVYLSGDTLVFPGVETIGERYRDIPVAVVHLGGTRLPGGALVTMDGRQGAELVRSLSPARVHPVHMDDYDRFTSPLSAFVDELTARGLDDRLRVLERGERTGLD